MSINTVLKIKIYPFIITLIFPQIGLCWDVVQYQRDGIDYVSVTSEYNGGYKLVLEKPCAGVYYRLYKPVWEIQAKSNIKNWVNLSNSSAGYDLYIDSNPYKPVEPIELTYDIGSNTATIKGDLPQSLLKGFERGSMASLRIKNLSQHKFYAQFPSYSDLYSDISYIDSDISYIDSDISYIDSDILVSLSLKGSRNAIQEASRQCNVLYEAYTDRRKEEAKKELIYIGVASVIGLMIAFMVLRWVFKKAKLVAKKVSNKSQEISIIVQNKVDEARKNRVYNKISESVLDEIVREAVRQAMREGVRPDDINICPKCIGEGCHYCDGKGWNSSSIS